MNISTWEQLCALIETGFILSCTERKSRPWSIWTGCQKSWIPWQTIRLGPPQSAATASHDPSAHCGQQHSKPLRGREDVHRSAALMNNPKGNIYLVSYHVWPMSIGAYIRSSILIKCFTLDCKIQLLHRHSEHTHKPPGNLGLNQDTKGVHQ